MQKELLYGSAPVTPTKRYLKTLSVVFLSDSSRNKMHHSILVVDDSSGHHPKHQQNRNE